MDTLVTFFLWAALTQGLFLGLTYIFSKKNRSLSNTFLGLFLIAIVLESLSSVLPYQYLGSYVLNEYFALPEVKLFIPLLFLHFILTKLGNSESYASFLRVNYGIATCISLIFLGNLWLFFTKSTSLVRAFDFFTIDRIHLTFQLYAFLISNIVFVIACKELLWFKRLVQNEFSDYGMLQVKWLWRFTYLLFPAILLWAAELLRIIFAPDIQSQFLLPLFGFLALFLVYVSYQAYIHPDFFLKTPKSILRQGDTNLSSINEKNICSSETSSTIEELMMANAYYLDQNLSLNSFAELIKMSPRLISNCVNQNLGQNFNEWVNGFRVKKSQELLENDKSHKLSIEGIGQESGFKSRSAFYAAFKNKLGYSPGEFRKRNSPLQ